MLAGGGCVRIVASAPAQAIKVGAPAPAFTATDSQGKRRSAVAVQGVTSCSSGTTKAVPSSSNTTAAATCPKVQKEWTAKKVVWLAVIFLGAWQAGICRWAGADRTHESAQCCPTAVLP